MGRTEPFIQSPATGWSCTNWKLPHLLKYGIITALCLIFFFFFLRITQNLSIYKITLCCHPHTQSSIARTPGVFCFALGKRRYKRENDPSSMTGTIFIFTSQGSYRPLGRAKLDYSLLREKILIPS